MGSQIPSADRFTTVWIRPDADVPGGINPSHPVLDN